MPPLAAPAQIWMLTTVNMNILAIAAAAASVQIHIGSALLVSLTPSLEINCGSHNFALQEAVPARVSGKLFVKTILTSI